MTIAKHLNVTKFPFSIKDDKGNEIYWETSYGRWWKKEYDSKGNRIYSENSDGFWFKKEYDSEGNEIYHETSSDGILFDNRPKAVPEYTMQELIVKLGHDFKIKK